MTKTKNMQQRESDRLQKAEQDLFRIIDHATETFCRLVDNDQPVLERVLKWTERNIESAPNASQVKDGTWTIEQTERFNLADELKSWIGRVTDAGSDNRFIPLLATSFVTIGIELINWHDVADHYLAKYRESIR